MAPHPATARARHFFAVSLTIPDADKKNLAMGDEFREMLFEIARTSPATTILLLKEARNIASAARTQLSGDRRPSIEATRTSQVGSGNPNKGSKRPLGENDRISAISAGSSNRGCHKLPSLLRVQKMKSTDPADPSTSCSSTQASRSPSMDLSDQDGSHAATSSRVTTPAEDPSTSPQNTIDGALKAAPRCPSSESYNESLPTPDPRGEVSCSASTVSSAHLDIDGLERGKRRRVATPESVMFIPTGETNAGKETLGVREPVRDEPAMLGASSSTSDADIEDGIICGDKSIRARLFTECKKLENIQGRSTYIEKTELEFNDLFHRVAKVDWVYLCDKLPTFLRNRKLSAEAIEMHDDEQMRGRSAASDPSEIMKAIRIWDDNTFNAKIKRAYYQIQLFKSVKEKVSKAGRLSGEEDGHLQYLRAMADKAAGPVDDNEKEAKYKDHLKHFYAGRRWLAVSDSFGNESIVFVFVIAEIGISFVDSSWTGFQRRSLGILATYMNHTKDLVTILGEDALETYCNVGYLSQDCIDELEAYQQNPVLENKRDHGSDDTDMEEDERMSSGASSEEEAWIRVQSLITPP